ncbi:glycosyltransferase family 2 protein [Nitratireductor kimnyeongensis]|uniref:Glycosyltransferase family 2 protein n=1 Tax=Nitratireductor kimnyeongensis TaxID=430679 RepID=A0ABW0T5C7_9HYPH|nr:glycosyltransferase [Nitratireductor kimnyeongensis]QZZ34837.1 glycosyltransferase [Nitratireductor kimnyeongensis]
MQFERSLGPTDLRIAVGIATTGRRSILHSVVPHLLDQTRPADSIVICAANLEDVDPEAMAAQISRTRIVFAERGLCRQRNRILESVEDADILLFLDDDFLLAPSYLEETAQIFRRYPDVVMSTGTVDADGILGPGIPLEDGLRLIGTCSKSASAGREKPVYSGYGCNMAVRLSTVRGYGLRFDENLPLYGWLEDVDFSRQLARYGRIVSSGRLHGVHLGTKSGRTSGLRLGYSQIANPVYLMGKKTMSPRHAAPQIMRNLVANAVKIVWPEPWVDRRGRLLGNMRAVRDLLRGRLSPQNVNVLE